MGIMPEGEDLRKAVKWVSEERKFNPEKNIGNIIQEACLKFDLSPLDADFLDRFIKEENA